MEFGQLITDILVNVSCKFEMYILKIAQVINENVRIAFLYVLSIFKNACSQVSDRCPLGYLFIGSSSFLQVTRTTIKAWMSSNLGRIPLLHRS